MEAVSNRLIFLWHFGKNRCRRKTDCPARPPLVAATCRVSTLRVRTPTAKRCALSAVPSIAVSASRVPALPDVAKAPLAALAPRYGKRLTIVRLLPRYRAWQSASFDASTCGRRFLLTSPSALDVVAPTAQRFESCASDSS